ncbi:hypothetical protein SUGI_0374750 [Cryptomeria japonica]|uniref:probable pterin-4-alpha-carbinolamine dehydratase, chloroplastic n=1 Tax=Cryptomeria japonica TaxID=3369 RepID=UPI002408DEDE|nr:probable pterin-4-alpha-carbinolamine dehydratase, chloroplastic [Cryptomeria japonica]GLJ20579.1 hypothetical protein SUGI_0374750 [Cryptomeria japonica]
MACRTVCPHNYGFVNKCPISTGVLGKGKHRAISSSKYKMGVRLVVRAADILGDFGARDPTTAEVESNFGENVVGNFGTDHKILVPNVSALSLAHMTCHPIQSNQPPISRHEATGLLRKVVGWRLNEVDGGLRLECLWKVKSFAAGIALLQRIGSVAEAANHHPDLHLQGGNSFTVKAQLWTHSIGGLSINDFIVAAKIDQINISDLVPRKRVWA